MLKPHKMKSIEQLEADNKRLRRKLRESRREYKALRDSADRFVLYTVGPHNAKALGLTNVPPMEIYAGNKNVRRA